MTTGVRFLADSSVLTRLAHAQVAQVLGPLLTAGQVGTCGVLDLCLYATIRDVTMLATVTEYRSLAFPWLSTDDRDLNRAVQVQALIAQTGQHLSPAWWSLIVAAVAERHQVTLLHYSSDYDLIAKVTGQDTQWVVPEGSLPAQAEPPGRATRRRKPSRARGAEEEETRP
jgi:predicted nucleic acid-binding protein